MSKSGSWKALKSVQIDFFGAEWLESIYSEHHLALLAPRLTDKTIIRQGKNNAQAKTLDTGLK